MKKNYSLISFKKIKYGFFITSFLFLSFFNSKGQNRNFGVVFSENLKGGTALLGNTLMYSSNANGTVNTVAMNGNSVDGNSLYDNGNFGVTNMQYIDIDGNTGDGAGTRNSSSADLILPAGTNTIKMARLYWGGRALKSDFDMLDPLNQRIKIRKGSSGSYQQFSAAQLNQTVINTGLSTEFSLYQAYVDIKDLVQQNGSGTYTVGDGTFSKGTGGDYGNYGAWSIVVVYENLNLNFNSVRVYDGYQQIFNGVTGVYINTITLTGLNVPSGALANTDAQVGLIAWEGDARFKEDSFKINGNPFSNAINPLNNVFNGTVSNDGVHVTTKNPNYTDQMGIDIDQFYVGTGYGILPNASNVTVQFVTSQDQYFTGVITFVIKMKDPIIKLSKSVADANSNQTAQAGEVLTYTLKGKNIGAGNANATILTDSLPSTITYVNNSLKVNYGRGVSVGIKTDISGDDIAEYDAATKTVIFRMGNNATATAGGYLEPTDSFEVEFKVTVNTPSNGSVPQIVNAARLSVKSDALVDFVDDATAVINPDGGSLPITLTAFSAYLLADKKVQVTWSTSMEYNSKSFDIERSKDGVTFKTVATKSATGNSTSKINYFINDDIADVTSPIVYYRLKQIDVDGKTAFSKIVPLKLRKALGNFTVSPNPFINNININIEWDKNETTVVKVYNIKGAEVVSKTVTMVKGYNFISIDELLKVPSGSYILQFNTPNGKLFKQVIKQK